MSDIDRALAYARGDIAPPLVKSDVPSGFQPVPGGKHGGYRKQVGGKWEYWYPDAASVGQARAHHAAEASRHAQLHAEAKTTAAKNTAHTAQTHHNDVASTLFEYETAVAAGDEKKTSGATPMQQAHNRGVDRRAEDRKRVAVGGPHPDEAGAQARRDAFNAEANKKYGFDINAALQAAEAAWAPGGNGSYTVHKSEPSMNRTEIALALARGDLAPEKGAQLIKALSPDPTDDDLSKAVGNKPPSGYVAIPGGAHGGFRKKVGAKWSYWYPDAASANAAAEHHTAEHKKAHKEYGAAQAAMTPGNPNYSRVATASENALAASNFHSNVAHGAKMHAIDRDIAESKKKRTAGDAERKVESDKLPDEAPAGHHYLSERGGVKRAVPTVAQHGLYAISGEATKNAFNPSKNSGSSYSITHVPSGMGVGTASTKAGAIATAKHWHEHAGDAGAGLKLHEQPGKEDMARFRSAFEKQGSKKSLEWQPINATPEQLGLDLSKGLAFPSDDRGTVRADAFKGIKPAQLRSTAGDTLLKGLGAGFDARWNDGSGFGG